MRIMITHPQTRLATLGNCTFEILTREASFLGLGAITIDGVLVRSGRLPLHPYSQAYCGAALTGLRLLDVVERPEEIRLSIEATFTALEIKPMRDHGFDPIHNLEDWDTPRVSGVGSFDLLLRPAVYTVNGLCFTGFSYHYRYESAEIPLYHILDKASWELDGDIAGATIYSQSSCSDPTVTVAPETFWTTEGELFFLDEHSHANRCMTHNLPRWASHQGFDFQWKGSCTLLGIFAHVDLIRSVLRREPGKAELKTFDKHLFDETLSYTTAPKAILLNCAPKSATAQQNIWTWVLDDVHARAREEFGLREQPPLPLLSYNYWHHQTVDTYYKDIVPACASLGLHSIFAENFKKSDRSEGGNGHPPNNDTSSMCSSHEYEISETMGGMAKFREYIATCHQLGMQNFLWTNSYMSISAQLNRPHGGKNEWFCALEDTRIHYGGAYTHECSALNLKHPEARAYWLDAHLQLARESGLDGYFIDSFYNLFFMPVEFRSGHPRTMWREALGLMKALQDAGLGCYIESFGPFGQPHHGHPASYNLEKIFICYYVGLGDGYTVVPVPGSTSAENIAHDPAFWFYLYAHKVPNAPPLFIDGERVDHVYGAEERRVIADYYRLLPHMHIRYLQEDGQGVLWHNAEGTQATLWNFHAREVALPGTVTALSTNSALPRAERYQLQACQAYAITDVTLPTVITTVTDG